MNKGKHVDKMKVGGARRPGWGQASNGLSAAGGWERCRQTPVILRGV